MSGTAQSVTLSEVRRASNKGGPIEQAAEDLIEDIEAAINCKPHSHPPQQPIQEDDEIGVRPHHKVYNDYGEPKRDLERGSSGDSTSSTQGLTAAVDGKTRPPAPLQPPPPEGKYEYPRRPLPSYAISRGCPAPPCYKKKIGRFYVYSETRDGRPLCIVGPCWPMFFVTFFLIAGGTAGVLGGLARDFAAVCVVGAVLAGISLTALTLTACRDPGIIQRRQERLNSEELYDERAMTFRPRGSMFEHETGTVIQDVDHFCPWTSTVIAGSNIISFKIFTSSLCLLILFSIGVAIWGVGRLGTQPPAG